MDVFEYAKVVIEWEKKEDEEDTFETFICVTTYDNNGKPIKNTEKSDTFHRQVWASSAGTQRGYGWEDPNYPLEIMTPVFTKMGTDGWEVVDFKFASGLDSFANALLKRKVQKD